MSRQAKRIDEKHIASSIFGSYILNTRTVPGVKPYSSKDKEELKSIMNELAEYLDQV